MGLLLRLRSEFDGDAVSFEGDRVTIHEHDRRSDHTDEVNAAEACALVDRLNAGEPYAVAFQGQGNSSWLVSLEEIITTAGIESELSRRRRGRAAAGGRSPMNWWLSDRSASSR